MNEEQLIGYIPETWVVLKDNIYAAQRAIRIGLEYIIDDIDHYENAHLTRQNEKYLEILKNEKLILEQALEGLSKPYSG
jgi:hypothetical protein